MYRVRPGLILGFHGCDQNILNKVLSGSETLKASTNGYDWLGHGIYFWDSSPSRAFEYANFLKNNPARAKRSIIIPAVLGAVINLGNCLDLLDYSNLQLVKTGYQTLKALEKYGYSLPKNKNVGSNNDLLLRELDCSVIEMLHRVMHHIKLPPFDSVRGVFWEGLPLYPNAGFREKNHIQICVRNPNCIKGYFVPRKLNNKFRRV